MKHRLLSLFILPLILAGANTAFSQDSAKATTPTTLSAATSPAAITASTSPLDLAKAAFAAQGGEKFRNVKSMVLRGSVDLYAPNSAQSIPGGFVIVTAGDKVRIEIDARPAIAFKQLYDGQRSYSSLPNVELPPMSKFGMAVLSKFDQSGYTVTAIPNKKKHRGFRIVDADGNATDFYIDPANGRVMSFLINYNGYVFGTENKKFKEIDGVLVASNFSQRLEMTQGAFFADYNAKDIKLNNPIGDDVFEMPN